MHARGCPGIRVILGHRPPQWRSAECPGGIETMLLARYPRTRDRVILMGAALLEFLGYRQILTVERLVALFQGV